MTGKFLQANRIFAFQSFRHAGKVVYDFIGSANVQRETGTCDGTCDCVFTAPNAGPRTVRHGGAGMLWFVSSR